MAFLEADTRQKALHINLDPAVYGSFAEIGAGQEIGRWFFQVGAAAGTVAKTISAYDMAVSDAIYGKSSRYVSRDRLISMLDHEYQLLLERLGSTRGKDTTFFVFADTVSARNFKGTNECHGWMGLRFQTAPGSPPNDIILHVNMLDKENVLQQSALGIVGVNLIYGALYDRANIDSLIENLVDDLGADRVEVDIITFSGPAFGHFDPGEVGLKLLELGLASAIVFSPERELIRASEVVHKMPVLIERGSYRALQEINTNAAATALTEFQKSASQSENQPISLVELSVNEVGQTVEESTRRKNLERIDALSALGHRVMVTKYTQFYEITNYLRRYTEEPLAFLMGIGTFGRLMNPTFYTNLDGRLLEGLGRLLSHNVKVYVYPLPTDTFLNQLAEDRSDIGKPKPGTKLVTIESIEWEGALGTLIQFLVEAGFTHQLPAD